MNILLDTCAGLVAALHADPLLSLAYTVAALDPLWREPDTDALLDDADGTIMDALRIVRQHFPDVYAEAVELLRAGATFADIDHLLCSQLTELGLPVDNSEWLSYGIPMPAYGAVLEDPDFYSTHPDVIPVLACFGISPEPNPYNVVVPDCVYMAGRLIAADLRDHADAGWQMDADAAGAEAVSAIAALSNAVRRVQVPLGKDMNELYLLAGRVAVRDWILDILSEAGA